MTKKKKVGRPTKYSEKIVAEILELRREGLSARKICEQVDINRATLQDWLDNKKDLSSHYAHASRMAFDDEFESLDNLILESVAPENLIIVTDKDGGVTGELKVDNALVSLIKLRVDTKKWALSKKRPDKYGVKADAPEQNAINKINIAPVMAPTQHDDSPEDWEARILAQRKKQEGVVIEELVADED